MKKVIAIVRTSTEQQEIEAQKKEIVDYILADGWGEEQIIICMAHGASAIKLDEEYRQNLAKVKSLILTEDIACVYAWALDRVGRDEVVLIDLKNFLINNKVNLRIKNPSLFLLNEDGTVNTGMELAISLFITLAKQEMAQKKARFMRAKRRNSEQGRYSGGKVKFGYKVDGDYIVIDEDEANTVRVIFNMYASKRFSLAKLAKELNDIGLTRRGDRFTFSNVAQILKDTSYLGYQHRTSKITGKSVVRIYQPIIDKGLFDAVEAIRDESIIITSTKEQTNCNLAIKILKCTHCGTNFSANAVHYSCYKRRFPERFAPNDICDGDNITIRVDIMDKLLWDLAIVLHTEYLNKTDGVKLEELEAEKITLQAKLNTVKARLANLSKAKERILDAFFDGDISKEKKEERIAKVDTDIKYNQSEIERLEGEIVSTDRLIEEVKNPSSDKIFKILEEVKSTDDKKKCREIVLQHIEEAYLERIDFQGRKCKLIRIKDKKGLWHKFIYSQMNKRYNEPPLFIWDGENYREYNGNTREMIKEAASTIKYALKEAYKSILQKDIEEYKDTIGWLELGEPIVGRYDNVAIQEYRNYKEYVDSPRMTTSIEQGLTKVMIDLLLRGDKEE